MQYIKGERYTFIYLNDVDIDGEDFMLIQNAENAAKHIIPKKFNIPLRSVFIAEIKGKDCSGRLDIEFKTYI
jgi:hypothetical protein